jgi:hypothetical protein
MSDTATIEAGKAAWARIQGHDGYRSWADWKEVARALALGRSEAMKTAKSNKPMGAIYNRIMGNWLRDNGLDGISNQARYRALLCLENLPAIEAWRMALSTKRRDRLNHPNAIWSHWKRVTQAKAPTPKAIVQRIAETAETARKEGRAVHWPQASLRRAHLAMLDSRSSDLLTLARAALEAAIRDSDDLLLLLDPPKPPVKVPVAAPAPALA